MAGEVVVFVVVQAACGPGWWAWKRLRRRIGSRGLDRHILEPITFVAPQQQEALYRVQDR